MEYGPWVNGGIHDGSANGLSGLAYSVFIYFPCGGTDRELTVVSDRSSVLYLSAAMMNAFPLRLLALLRVAASPGHLPCSSQAVRKGAMGRCQRGAGPESL